MAYSNAQTCPKLTYEFYPIQIAICCGNTDHIKRCIDYLIDTYGKRMQEVSKFFRDEWKDLPYEYKTCKLSDDELFDLISTPFSTDTSINHKIKLGLGLTCPCKRGLAPSSVGLYLKIIKENQDCEVLSDKSIAREFQTQSRCRAILDSNTKPHDILKYFWHSWELVDPALGWPSPNEIELRNALRLTRESLIFSALDTYEFNLFFEFFYDLMSCINSYSKLPNDIDISNLIEFINQRYNELREEEALLLVKADNESSLFSNNDHQRLKNIQSFLNHYFDIEEEFNILNCTFKLIA